MDKDGISNLFRKIRAPFVIEKDVDYYQSVQTMLHDLIIVLYEYKADIMMMNKIKKFIDTVLSVLREYYKGNIAYSQIKMTNIIKTICKEDKDAANDINNCKVFGGDNGAIPFFRARLDADEDGFKAKDMGVIPFSLRTKTKTERFSMPGLPCLYLGNTSYVCWLEMGKPAEHRFNVSPVLIDRTLKVFDMTVNASYLFDIDGNGKTMLSKKITPGLLKRIVLALCSLFRVKEYNRDFKSEYIIPQLIMLACQKIGLDGVAYISSKISNSGISGVCAINVALYARYPHNKYKSGSVKSELEDHIQIDDAFNYAMFKQFLQPEFSLNSPLWLDRCRWIKNIEINNMQFAYRETQFYDFDKFLFNRWEKKLGYVKM